MSAGVLEKMQMSDGAQIGVYHVQPTGERRGGLVLVQEIFGITAHIRSLCDEYAADGYEVLAPAIYDREAPGFEATYDEAGMARSMDLAFKQHPFEQSVEDVRTCVDALKASGPVFVVGYCYGGSVAWLAATRMDGVAAVSAYYGSRVPDYAGEEPKVPVILHFGREDHSIPMERVAQIEAKDWPNATVYVYDAGHGFNSDRADHHDAAASALARARTLELFRANGG